MRTDCLYRHRNNRDAAFEVIKAFYIKEKDAWSLKVGWWNIGACHKPYPLGIAQRITLPASALKQDWVRMEYGELGPTPQHVSL